MNSLLERLACHLLALLGLCLVALVALAIRGVFL